jgi:HEAT repeat protein
MAKTQKKQAPSQAQPPLYAPETGWSLFVKLFIVPAAIVGVALGIFFLGAMALQNPKTAEEFLRELRGDSTTKRWQAAFELSRLLNKGDKEQFGPQMREELVAAYKEAGKDDPRVRQYLALVLGTLKEKSAVPVLSQGVSEGNKEVKLYSLWALGNIEDPAGGEVALVAMSDEDPGVRRMAVGAVSSLRYEKARFALQKNLQDTSAPLRFDSAVALSRLKDETCFPVLLEMMSVKTDEKGSDVFARSAKLAALKGYGELPSPKLRPKVVELSKNDPDLKVRDAALKALKK